MLRRSLPRLSWFVIASLALVSAHGRASGRPGERPASPAQVEEAGNCGASLEARAARAACAFGPGSRCDATIDLGGGATGDFQAVPIQYVFVLMQENRSFDSYFGRFPAYLRQVLGKTEATDVRVKPFANPDAPDGVDVPGTPYELRDEQQKAVQDAKLDSTYDPRVDAPFNPWDPGRDPPNKDQKVYWQHGKEPLQQCVSDTCHEWWCSHMAWNSGRMDGFYAANQSFHEGGEPNVDSMPELLDGKRALYYYDQTDIPFYYWLADRFGLGDRYFAAMLGPTWPNRDYLYGATSRGLVSNATDDFEASLVDQLLGTATGIYAGDQAPNPPVQIAPDGTPLNTIYDALTAAGVEYTHYVRQRYNVRLAKWGTWFGSSGILPATTTYSYDHLPTHPGSGFERHVRTEDALVRSQLAVGADPTTIVPHGVTLPEPTEEMPGGLSPVSFIDPDYLEDVNAEDEHPPGVPQMGQRLVYDVVRILMAYPEVWKRSVLFVTYDEGGGFYDHVDPPEACPPDDVLPKWTGPYGEGPKGDKSDRKYAGEFDRYGFRVPLLVISPWVKRQYVSHHTYDHTSIVRFIGGVHALPALTRRDANADPLLDFFDFTGFREKLAGTAPNPDPGWAAEGLAWGQERLPDAFPIAPGVAVSANSVRWYGGPEGEIFKMQAPAACLAAMPPATGSPVDLGANPYDPLAWSPGKEPPLCYDAQKSDPFPNQSSKNRPGTCSPADGAPIRVKVVATLSDSPNDTFADAIYDVRVLVGGTEARIPPDDNLARVEVAPGKHLVKFPRDNGLDDEMGEPLYRVGSVTVNPTSGQAPSLKCKPTSQEGDVTAPLDVYGDVASQSDYEIGVRIVPFDAEPLEGGVDCQ